MPSTTLRRPRRKPPAANPFTVAEFFAGIGLVRLALEREGWKVTADAPPRLSLGAFQRSPGIRACTRSRGQVSPNASHMTVIQESSQTEWVPPAAIVHMRAVARSAVEGRQLRDDLAHAGRC